MTRRFVQTVGAENFPPEPSVTTLGVIHLQSYLNIAICYRAEDFPPLPVKRRVIIYLLLMKKDLCKSVV